MGRSKQNKGTKKDGQHRGETKEERKARLAAEAEAREKCFKALPYVGGVLLFCLIAFAMYIRSVPPKMPKPKQTPSDFIDGKPDFLAVNTEGSAGNHPSMVSEALNDASDVLMDLDSEQKPEAGATEL